MSVTSLPLQRHNRSVPVTLLLLILVNNSVNNGKNSTVIYQYQTYLFLKVVTKNFKYSSVTADFIAAEKSLK